MLKILQARPQQHMNHELPDVQAGNDYFLGCHLFFFFFRMSQFFVHLIVSNSNLFCDFASLSPKKVSKPPVSQTELSGHWKNHVFPPVL